MSITAFLDKLDYRQLQFCRDECERRIRAIQEDYLKAVELLARKAAERWERADKENPETKYELNLYIEGNRLPLSEYNALFADGEWG